MRISFVIIISLLSLPLFAQDGMSIQLEKSINPSCLTLTLSSENPEDVLLKGQNYRFFYNNNTLDFASVNVRAELAVNNFSAQVALHRDGLTKEINGKIPFEDKMGFVSMNVMPDNEILDHVYMRMERKVEVADVCFAQEVNLDDVILASKEVTSEYSRAYCVIDWESANQAQFTTDLEFLSEDGEIDKH